jgi:hypothetical protein
VQTYKKASVNVSPVSAAMFDNGHVQGLLRQGVVAVAVCKAATRKDKAEAAWHADASTKSAAVPAKHKAVELHVDLHAQQLVPTSLTELTPTSRCWPPRSSRHVHPLMTLAVRCLPLLSRVSAARLAPPRRHCSAAARPSVVNCYRTQGRTRRRRKPLRHHAVTYYVTRNVNVLRVMERQPWALAVGAGGMC